MRFLLACCCFVISSCFACTDFILEDQNKKYVVGRSMEFGIELHSEIIVVPQEGTKQSMPDGQAGLRWEQKYAFIGLSVLGNDQLIIDGLNEQGLSIGGLWLPGTVYPTSSSNPLDQTIALQDVGRWILGSFSTVVEVKNALERVYIFPTFLKELGKVPPLHFSLHDRMGNSLVVEFIDGKMEINENSLGVLTNAPKFEWHVTNLGNYINLSAFNAPPTKFDDMIVNPLGQGSGMLGLPGDWTPPSRFVKIAMLKQYVKKAGSQKMNADLAFHLLNTVDIPYGVIQVKDDKAFDYTQWVVVKDLSRGILYYRTYKNLNIGSVNLSEALKKGTRKIQMD